MNLSKFLYYANIPQHITRHVIGKDHTQKHKRIAGFFVMLFGVWFAHLFEYFHLNTLINLLADLIGYSIHGTGLLPFIHDLEKIENDNH